MLLLLNLGFMVPVVGLLWVLDLLPFCCDLCSLPALRRRAVSVQPVEGGPWIGPLLACHGCYERLPVAERAK